MVSSRPDPSATATGTTPAQGWKSSDDPIPPQYRRRPACAGSGEVVIHNHLFPPLHLPALSPATNHWGSDELTVKLGAAS